MTSTILMEAITPTVLLGEPKAPGEGSYMRDQRTGDVPPTGACKDGRYGSKQEARRKKAPKDERLNRHHANSSSDFWENQELQGMRITRKIKGPKRYHSREEGDYYEDSLEESHHAKGSSSFQKKGGKEDQGQRKTTRKDNTHVLGGIGRKREDGRTTGRGDPRVIAMLQCYTMWLRCGRAVAGM